MQKVIVVYFRVYDVEVAHAYTWLCTQRSSSQPKNSGEQEDENVERKKNTKQKPIAVLCEQLPKWIFLSCMIKLKHTHTHVRSRIWIPI